MLFIVLPRNPLMLMEAPCNCNLSDKKDMSLIENRKHYAHFSRFNSVDWLGMGRQRFYSQPILWVIVLM